MRVSKLNLVLLLICATYLSACAVLYEPVKLQRTEIKNARKIDYQIENILVRTMIEPYVIWRTMTGEGRNTAVKTKREESVNTLGQYKYGTGNNKWSSVEDYHVDCNHLLAIKVKERANKISETQTTI